MSNDDTNDPMDDKTGENHPGGAVGNGPSDIPEESAGSEDELALSRLSVQQEAEARQKGE